MPRRHMVLALVVAVCWAVNFVVIDIGLESFPPLLFAALRFGLTAFPAIFVVSRPDVRWRAVVAVGLFIGVGQFGVLFVAMNTGLPAGLASVIAPLQPVFTIPFAVIALGERPSLRQVIGVSLAIAGLGAIAVGRARGVPLQAVALGVASAASWGCGNVVTRAAKPKRPFSLLVWSSVVAPLPLLGLSRKGESSINGSIPTARSTTSKSACTRKRRPAALLQSPLTDSNRRPPPCHGGFALQLDGQEQCLPAGSPCITASSSASASLSRDALSLPEKP